MAVQSMTGFASTGGLEGRYRWSFELRSVNGKGLDLRLRLPSGFEHLEGELRRRAGIFLTRGNLQVALSVSLADSRLELVVNETVLNAVLALKERLGDKIDQAPLTIDGLLGIRGIADFRETEEEEAALAARDVSILSGFDAALERLVDMRRAEGEKIAAVLSGQIDKIEQLTVRVEQDPSRSAKAIAEKLKEQVARLVEGQPSLDPDRLYAEAALLATKADLQEEIDRLHAHVAAARALLAEGGPCGRKLDFLAQEFNRETNTICSKSNAVAVTTAGLELKVVIDQLREQVQNVE
ncbi:YicC family protein [Martelella alba]|uniref:YicC family protein n=1 Tax=Martelella alba TaxID=2590451 RepID=A0A506UJA3_9HYPH|nr:YicC/YloC family endoribonuclease [Martelella alba]TPW33400.1 YicC family protein [Martelella alba]